MAVIDFPQPLLSPSTSTRRSPACRPPHSLIIRVLLLFLV